MNIFIYEPHTEDWSKLNKDNFIEHYKLKFASKDLEKNEKFIDNIVNWKYEPYYTELRHQIKEISRYNRSRIQCPIVNNLSTCNSEDILLLTDDDDWFNPLVVEKVRTAFEEDESLDVVTWNCWNYKICKEEQFVKREDVGSNGFAIKRKMPWKYHSAGAHVWIPDLENRIHLDEDLSIWTVHPMSFYLNSNYKLEKALSRRDRAQVPENLNWASKEIEMMFEIISNMKMVK